MDRGSIILELTTSLAIPYTREDTLIITMEDIHTTEEVHTTTMALRMVMGMEEATVRAIPTPQHPPRRI